MTPAVQRNAQGRIVDIRVDEGDDSVFPSVPPPREPEDPDWATGILRDLRAFVSRLREIANKAPTVSQYVLTRGVEEVRTFEQRVESLEKATTYAREMCGLARGYLDVMARKTEL